MDLGFKDKVVLIAGSSKGLGLGIAQALAKEGASLSLGSRNEVAIKEVSKNLANDFNIKTKGYRLDVTDPKSISNWINSTISEFGKIDSLVVNAGGPASGKFEDFDDVAWQKAFELTLLSAVRMIRTSLPYLKKSGSASILTITSTSIKEPIPNLMFSNVFRSAVANLVKTLSSELSAYAIRVNNIVPGRIDTDRVKELDLEQSENAKQSFEEIKSRQHQQIALKRYGSIEEFGAAATFLLSEKASYITGTSLIVDGGKMKSII